MAATTNGDGRRRVGWRLGGWAVVTALILLVPLVAMQFTDEVAWSGFDFVFAAAILFGAAATYELAAAGTRLAYRGAVAAAIIGAVLLVWINGAVGVIGSENNPANLMYLAVLGVGLAGAGMARMRPGGMVRTLVAMAVVQVLVAAIALSAGLGDTASRWPRDVLGATGIFAAIWLVSAFLFRQSARTPSGRPQP